MLKKLRVKYLTHEIKRLRAKNKKIRAALGKDAPWGWPGAYLSPKEQARYRRLSEKRFSLVPNFGTDVTGQNFDRLGDEASKPLDAVNAEYKEVVPTYFDEDGQPKGTGNFVSD